jgi:hypothetical protein
MKSKWVSVYSCVLLGIVVAVASFYPRTRGNDGAFIILFGLLACLVQIILAVVAFHSNRIRLRQILTMMCIVLSVFCTWIIIDYLIGLN